MPSRTNVTGSKLFIVDNSDNDWRLLRRLRGWREIPKAIRWPTGRFEIGAPLTLKDKPQKIDQLSFRRP